MGAGTSRNEMNYYGAENTHEFFFCFVEPQTDMT